MLPDEQTYPRDHYNPCKQGRVGWDDDNDIFDLGDESNEGPTLVKVTLTNGRDFTKDNEGRAQGQQIVARLLKTVGISIPEKGDQCLLMVPDGFEGVAGGAVIVGTIAAPRQRAIYGNLKSGEFAIWGGNGDASNPARIVGKLGAKLVFYTTDNAAPNGNGVFMTIEPGGLKFGSPHGNLLLNDKGFSVKTRGGCAMRLYTMGGLPPPLGGVMTNFFVVQAHGASLPSTFVGPGPYVPALGGLTGIAGLPSGNLMLTL